MEEYAIFIATVREYQKDKCLTLEEAITRAIDESIEKGILKDILAKQRNEVFSVILSTFDKELYEKDLKEEAYEEGYEKGIYAKLYELVARQIMQGKTVEEIAEVFGEPVEVIRKIAGDVERTDR